MNLEKKIKDLQPRIAAYTISGRYGRSIISEIAEETGYSYHAVRALFAGQTRTHNRRHVRMVAIATKKVAQFEEWE